MSTTSCPLQPWSAPEDSCLWFLSWSQSISYLVFFFSAAFYFSQHYCHFQRTLPFHDVLEIGKLQYCHFCLQKCFGLNLLEDPLVFSWSTVSVELSSDTVFQMNQFSSYLPSSLSNISNWQYEGVHASTYTSFNTLSFQIKTMVRLALSWITKPC